MLNFVKFLFPLFFIPHFLHLYLYFLFLSIIVNKKTTEIACGFYHI